MKCLCEEYILSRSVGDALQSLAAANGTVRILSGGSDLLVELQQGSHQAVKTLVDVTEIEEICALEIRDKSLFIGASVTLTRLKDSLLIKQHAQALAEAAALMGNPQVCNVATIGGNVAHALPAADDTISLLALDAQAEVACLEGRRRAPLSGLFKGPGQFTLDPGCNLLVGFYLPLHADGQASAFARRISSQGIALALVNMAIWLQRRRERVEDIRIAVGPLGPVPLRMKAAEKYLTGKTPSPQVLAQAQDELLQEAHFRTSLHWATVEYRWHLAGILLDEAFTKAWQRAG
jgi:carbon-monoxide dehydrogenase medium subunit